MKLKLLLIALFSYAFSLGQINENIQSWTNQGTYGNYTQVIPAGTVNLTQCIVQNGAAATGTCSAGRVQMNSSSGIITLPTLPSVGTAEFRMAAGAAGRTVKLQYFDGAVWQDLTTFTGIGTTGATYTYIYNTPNPTTLRLSAPSAALFVHDITISLNCTPPANPAGTISGVTPACSSTTLSYSAPNPNLYWQTTAFGTSLANPTTASLPVSASGTYFVRAYDGVSCWSSGSVSYAVTVNSPPAITTQPVDRNIMETNNTTFTVVATNVVNYQWQLSTNGGATFANISNGGVYSGATAATLNITGATLAMNGYKYQCIIIANAPCANITSSIATLTVTVFRNSSSDLLYIGGSSPATISSTVNNASPLTSGTGVQVMQFQLRDGGSAAPDADALPTILTGFTIAKVSNTVANWSDAIQTIELFNGASNVGIGVVTANTITFSGLNITAPDNASVTLTLRLSLNCPLQGATVDNNYFGFSISNVNTTVSSSGSGITTFTAVQNAPAAGSTLRINVTATRLVFTQQPTSTGIGNAMANVVVTAVDACGNKDFDFTGNVSLSSTGTMTGSPIVVAAVSGAATYLGIVHTVQGTGLVLLASSTGLSSVVSTPFNITPVTIFSQGDFAVVGLNSNINTAGCSYTGTNAPYSAGDDEISFITFKDIQNGDVFYMTDNGYERATAGLWGDTEGVYQVTRNGATLSAGTVITFRFLNTAPFLEFTSPDASWNFTKATGFTGNLVMNTGGDQIFFMQGGSWNNPAGVHDATYTPGTFLYAFNTGTTWTSLGNSTQQSALPLELRCFSLMPGSATDYLEYTGPTNPTSKFDWIVRLNNPANWTNRVSCAGYTRMHVGMSYNITPDSYVEGIWTGSKSTDWFDCANWQTLKVPNDMTNVEVKNPESTQDAIIDISSPNAALYGNIAKCKDLTISRYKVQLEGNSNNKLEVHGNLSINNPFGVLDMDDGNPATADGQLYLYGNWTNSNGTPEFYEGNGTVHFTGSSPQIINNVMPDGTEVFYHVVVNNNFDTSISNDIIATGNLTVSAGKTLTVTSNRYVQVNNNLTVTGTLTVDNNGSLIQVTNTGVNTGNITYKRIAQQRRLDYVYWSSPVDGFNLSSHPSDGNKYLWNTTFNNANGTQGNWQPASGTMNKGQGYIISGPSTFTNTANQNLQVSFFGLPRNGIVPVTIYRGNYTGSNYTLPNGVTVTNLDDNWNLLGNPYPSSISCRDFLTNNTSVLTGALYIWSHGTLPSAFTSNPYYDEFVSNYDPSDYLPFNLTGNLANPNPDYYIGAGQGFFVTMQDGSAGNATVNFNNSLRNRTYGNATGTNFFRSSALVSERVNIEQNRIWLDLVNERKEATRMMFGYVEGATMDRDYLYDAPVRHDTTTKIYSLLDDEGFQIQGRALPFDDNDRVPVGIDIEEQGFYTIGIAFTDAVFSETNQNIYLEDTYLNRIHNLRIKPYRFVSETGMFKDRFTILFKENTLGNSAIDSLKNSVIVFGNRNGLHVKSMSKEIKDITVYDISGRRLLNAENLKSHHFTTSSLGTLKQVLIVKVTLENDFTVTEKILL